MTAKESVFKALKKQKKVAESEDVAALTQEWVHAIESLFEQIQNWLKDVVDKKLLQVKTERKWVLEERIGSYFVPVLDIVTPSGVSVQVVPKGRFVIGAKGRVDLECPPKKAILVRKISGSWQIAEPAGPQGWNSRDLTEESFWAVVGNFIG